MDGVERCEEVGLGGLSQKPPALVVVGLIKQIESIGVILDL